MSFRGDDQRRYGHVPPVQYPVAGQPSQQQHPQQQQQHPQPQPPYPTRRQSFNSGDDMSYFASPHGSISHHAEEELFLSSGDATAAAPPPLPVVPAKPTAYGGLSPSNSTAAAGYQHHYQGGGGGGGQMATDGYNPQAFARSQSQSLPYRPHGSLSSPTSSSFSQQSSLPQQPQQSYTPPVYNPMAYANTSAAMPQRTSTYAGYSSYQPVPPPPSSSYGQNVSAASSYSQVQPQQQQQQQQQQYQPASYYGSTAATVGTSSYDAQSQSLNQASYPGASSYYATTPSQSTTTNTNTSTTPSGYASSNGISPLPTPSSGITASTSAYALPNTMTSQSSYLSYVPSSQQQLQQQSGYAVAAAAASDPSIRTSRANSNASPLSPTLPPPPPQQQQQPPLQSQQQQPVVGIQRHPTNAPLPSRPPMDDVLEEPIGWQQGSGGGITQESLIQDIEADLGIGSMGNIGSNGTNGVSSISTSGHPTQMPAMPPLPDTPSNGNAADELFHRNNSTSSTGSNTSYQAVPPSAYGWEDDSDPEGAFGVYEMQQADLDEQRFSISGASMASGGSHGSISGPSASRYGYGDSYASQQQQQQQQQQPLQQHQHQNNLPPPPEENDASDSEPPVGIDIGLFSGGYTGNLTYGTTGTTSSTGATLGTSPRYGEYRPPTSTTPRPYENNHSGANNHNNNSNNNNEYAPFLDAEMDYDGTGGLQAPDVQQAGWDPQRPGYDHRYSFDDGDEHASVHSGNSGRSARSGRSGEAHSGGGSDSPYREDYPDMFYHPGLSNRPLPALPPQPSLDTTGTADNNLLSAASAASAGRPAYLQHSYSLSDSRLMPHQQQQQQPQPSFSQSQLSQLQQQQLHVERSTSMSSHSTTPVVQVPGRSRTDAAEERRKAQRQMAQHGGVLPPVTPPYDYEAGAVSGANAGAAALPYDVITLPSGRRRKFVPSKLSAADFRRCPEPWALSCIARWIREMADGEPDLKRKTIEEGFVTLFTAKVPNMNVADAETLATMVADSMFAAGILIPEEEWVKFGQGSISGVLWQLTGAGCYAPRVHEVVGTTSPTGRCYSYHCTRTLKKANLDELGQQPKKQLEWAEFYGVKPAMIEGKPEKELRRQYNLHEIVGNEEEFNRQLEVLRVLYRDQLRYWKPPIIPPNRLDKFLEVVFGKFEAIQRINKDHLLAQLKYRQHEQGPWIAGFSDIFREWIRKAKDAFIAFSATYPQANFMVRKEAARNKLFFDFLETMRRDERSQRLSWDTYLKAPITQLQRYSLQLSTVLKNTVHDSEEKANLAKAIDEIRAVTKECDHLVDDMSKKVSLQELQNQLVFRPGSQTVLNLDHLGRELLMQGDLQRMGSKGVRWVDTHALLFDHYFILAKAVSKERNAPKKYDVSKEPIPMPLLLLESINDDPITKQKGITAPLARTAAASASDTRLNKVLSNNPSRPELEHASTGSSLNSTISRLNPGTPSGEEGKILYPFRVKHLGHEIYTLYATSAQSRQDWCSKIIEAKTRHARALLEQNAEPFRLRVVADSAFAYDMASAVGKTPGVSIRGTPLDRAIREMEQVFGPGRGPPPVSRAMVNCAAGFKAYGKSIIAIGTDFGVFIADASNPRGWSRTVQVNKVTQMAVLEEFSICVVLADKALISYPLDVVAPVSQFPTATRDSPRKAPQRLAKDVSFFATARMKDRMLLFYKRKEGMHNTFKVLEPVFHKATEKKSRLFGRSGKLSGSGGGSGTESFRDFDEFYLPIDCYSLNLFQTYVAVSTAKGIEMLTLDRKQTMSVPSDLHMPATAKIAARIRDQRPLGMFRLNDQEFLLAYEDCAVYADKHGEVSRTLIMEYSGKQKKAKAATMFGQHLLLFNEDCVEVRNAENGRLRQIIAGHDVRCLDAGFRGPTGGDNAAATAASAVEAAGGRQLDSQGTVKMAMTHPEVPGMQLVLELLLNDGHAEKA